MQWTLGNPDAYGEAPAAPAIASRARKAAVSGAALETRGTTPGRAGVSIGRRGAQRRAPMRALRYT